MFEKIKSRYVIYGVLLLAMFVFMGAGLYDLTIVHGEESLEEANKRRLSEIALQGQRGRILDRNGLPLAYNQKSYDIEFYRDPSLSQPYDYARYTRILMETIRIIESGGGETISTFPIVRDENMNFVFYWGDISAEASATREKNWRANMFVDTANFKRTPEQIYRYLRRKYQIPDELGYDETHKLLSIWQEVSLNTWVAYRPVPVAYNVPIETVAQLELKSIELEGIRVSEGNVRIYPQGQLAAHSIGYLGRINERESIGAFITQGFVTEEQFAMLEDDEKQGLAAYESLGYNRENLIGKTGIELTMEPYLTGNTTAQAGWELVEINNQANIVRSIDQKAPVDGHDVMLTLDLDLQKVAEAALENNILETRARQEQQLLDDPGAYDNALTITNRKLSDIRLAEYGAVVVMDVNTGEVLALASYPSFDLNLFTGGISQEDLDALTKGDAERTTPLYNKAIRTKTAPGSTFKMATAIAGLEEGVITPTETISDESPFWKYDSRYANRFITGARPPSDAPNCWVRHPSDHANLTVEYALRDSCNYFFCEVAYRLGIDKLNMWASKLGLDSLTGIELDGETRGQIGGQPVLYDKTVELSAQRISRPILVANNIRDELKQFCNELNLDAATEEIEECTLALLQLVDPNELEIGPKVRQVMSEKLGIPVAVSEQQGWHLRITSQLGQIRWTAAETVRTGFGQSITLVTPIAAARYISALVNGGTVYNASIVRRIVDTEGKTVKNFEPTVFQELNADPVNMEQIMLGMRDAVSPEDSVTPGGSAGAEFADFVYSTEIGGKTGTAQMGGSRAANIDLENTSWFAAYCPRQEPEIAIIVYIPNGWKGAMSSTAIRDIVQFYMDRKTKQAPDNIPGSNTLVTG